MNISLLYTLIYDIISPEPLALHRSDFGRIPKIPKIMRTKKFTRTVCLCHRFHPINIHFNNNEIIIIFTEQNGASRPEKN